MRRVLDSEDVSRSTLSSPRRACLTRFTLEIGMVAVVLKLEDGLLDKER